MVATIRARMLRGLLAVPLAALAVPAHADLWVRVDEGGQAHFAPTRVDARYTLFFKGRTSLDPPPAPPPEPALPPDPSVLAAEALRDHPILRRVDGHPNVLRYAALVDEHSQRNGLDPALVRAVIAVESAFDPSAVSDKGAVGLMQVLPETAERYGVAGDAKRSAADKLKEPSINLRVGARHLGELLARYPDDPALALAAYNAGEGAVERHRGVPPYPETREYVRLVRLFRDWYRPPAPPPVPSTPSAPSAAAPAGPHPPRIVLERAGAASR